MNHKSSLPRNVVLLFLLQTSVVFGQGITIAWNDNSIDETGFKIERSTNGSTYVQIAVVGANVKSYTDASADPAKSNAYRVRAYNSVGHSVFSNTASALAPIAVTPPSSAKVVITTGQ